jgi:hypothetical protein
MADDYATWRPQAEVDWTIEDVGDPGDGIQRCEQCKCPFVGDDYPASEDDFCEQCKRDNENEVEQARWMPHNWPSDERIG